MEKNKLTRIESLTLEMTNLANERSFLAYIRTVVVVLSSSLAILKLELFQDLKILGYILGAMSPIILTIGIVRFFQVKKTIKRIILKG